MDPPGKRTGLLFVANIFLSTACVGVGVWLAVWSFLPPPEPPSPRQIRQGRYSGLIVFGAFSAGMALLQALQLLLCVFQIIAWRDPSSRATICAEGLIRVRIPTASFIFFFVRTMVSIYALVGIFPRPRSTTRGDRFNPSKKLAFTVGTIVSIGLHLLADLGEQDRLNRELYTHLSDWIYMMLLSSGYRMDERI